MIKAILIDDEPLARQLIRMFLQEWEQIKVVAECQDGYEGFRAIQEHQPDLLFLDIQMPRINAFEMLELLDHPPSVIFTTAFDEYALQAFDNHAIDYLLKPLTRERFQTAIKKWMQHHAGKSRLPIEAWMDKNRIEGYQHRVVVKEQGQIRIVPAADISYIEACDDYVRIYTAGGYFLKKTTLSRMEQSLDPRLFVRAHRSFMIPVKEILKIETDEKEGLMALLRCKTKVPVSKSGLQKLKTLLGW